jgi:inorganic pyrophosphatase/exopolyphosphatase
MLIESEFEPRIHELFKSETVDGLTFVPGLLSRKKQVIPVLTEQL